MGGKKKRYIAYTGSLLTPTFRYMLKVQFNYCRFDTRGSGILAELFKEVTTTPKKYLQPNLDVAYQLDKKAKDATLYLKFLNGLEHTIRLRNTDMISVKRLMEFYNQEIELERAERGQDDEPEDEDAYLE